MTLAGNGGARGRLGRVVQGRRWPSRGGIDCKYTDTRRGVANRFAMMFDDLRNVAYLLDGGRLVEGNQTSITYQALGTLLPGVSPHLQQERRRALRDAARRHRRRYHGRRLPAHRYAARRAQSA